MCGCIYFILIGLLLFADRFLLARFVCDKRLGRCNAVVVVVIINGPTHTHSGRHTCSCKVYSPLGLTCLSCVCMCAILVFASSAFSLLLLLLNLYRFACYFPFSPLFLPLSLSMCSYLSHRPLATFCFHVNFLGSALYAKI